MSYAPRDASNNLELKRIFSTSHLVINQPLVAPSSHLRNSYFTQFDEICAKHEVTKIETVGEEYVCAVGVVPKDWEVDKALGHQAGH